MIRLYILQGENIETMKLFPLRTEMTDTILPNSSGSGELPLPKCSTFRSRSRANKGSWTPLATVCWDKCHHKSFKSLLKLAGIYMKCNVSSWKWTGNWGFQSFWRVLSLLRLILEMFEAYREVRYQHRTIIQQRGWVKFVGKERPALPSPEPAPGAIAAASTLEREKTHKKCHKPGSVTRGMAGVLQMKESVYSWTFKNYKSVI